jgi:hypothetical protein
LKSSFVWKGVIGLRVLLPIVACGLFFMNISFAQSAPTPPEAAAIPNGSVLALGDTCYTITANKDGSAQPIGYVFQSLKSQQIDGTEILTVVVHQHLLSRRFDMRDSLVLRRVDLLPLHLDTDRDGVPHVHLDYVANRVTGWKMVNGSKESIDVKFAGPVWDGNLWRVTFAALPLKTGKSYQLPTYQYDSARAIST